MQAFGSFDVTETIARKRDGGSLSAAELRAFVRGVVERAIPEHQATALLMAIYLRGLGVDETAALTRAITDSGHVLDLADLGPVVDKHSTGGVGDAVSFIAGPLAAACGVVVPMISGRTLGHTGGTLDKLESVPGLRVALAPAEFRRAVERAGIAIVEAGPELAPGDAVLYRLRDQSATIAEHGLIVASILGKKMCVSPRGLVMDLKTGRGGFLPTRDAARELARRLGAVARELGLEVSLLATDMDVPLSPAVGNAVEIERSIRILRGEFGDGREPAATAAAPAGPAPGGVRGDRLLSLSLTIAGEMVHLAGLAPDAGAGRDTARRALAAGRGIETFRAMIDAQGGDARVVDDLGRLASARERLLLRAPRDGVVIDLDARAIGEAAGRLGVGRGVDGAAADPGAGVVLAVEIGDEVRAGDPLAELRASSRDRLDAAAQLLEAAMQLGAGPLQALPTDPVLERAGGMGGGGNRGGAAQAAPPDSGR